MTAPVTTETSIVTLPPEYLPADGWATNLSVDTDNLVSSSVSAHNVLLEDSAETSLEHVYLYGEGDGNSTVPSTSFAVSDHEVRNAFDQAGSSHETSLMADPVLIASYYTCFHHAHPILPPYDLLMQLNPPQCLLRVMALIARHNHARLGLRVVERVAVCVVYPVGDSGAIECAEA